MKLDIDEKEKMVSELAVDMWEKIKEVSPIQPIINNFNKLTDNELFIFYNLKFGNELEIFEHLK